MLIVMAILVFIFDVFCCWLIYSAVEENVRPSGWGPISGDAPLMQHGMTGDKQFRSSNGR